jgi:pimeloyl-ACP methyl ester carboxylesterase
MPSAGDRAHAGRVVTLIFVLVLLCAAPASAGEVDTQRNGVLFVHGFVGTGAQFESQQMRFSSNRYPDGWVTAIDYDSTFATESRQQVFTRIDGLVADLKRRTGRPKVDILGHSLGTSVMQEYLNSSPERAANVAHYVNIDGREADSPPAGVPTLAVWAGRGEPGRRIAGARNVTIPNQTHVEVATSAESFVEYYKFFTGSAPAHDLVPQRGQVTIAGRVLHFPVNRGVVGATMEIWPVDGTTGRRTQGAPAHRFSIDTGGDWGPVRVDAGRHYEFAVSRPGAQTHHHYYEPFLRNDPLIRVLESDALTALGERGNHVGGVVLRYKELWGDQPGDSDALSIGGTSVCTAVICPISKRVNALFFSDRGSDRRTDLSRRDPAFDALPFVAGADLFVPAATPPTRTVAVQLRSRGGGPARTVNFPNFASLTDVVTVQLRDFDKVGAPAGRRACRRKSAIRFKLRRTQGRRIVRVVAYVNGKRKLRRSGRDIRRVTLRRLPRTGRMSVRIVATDHTGDKLISTRRWDGCRKGKPRMRRG